VWWVVGCGGARFSRAVSRCLFVAEAQDEMPMSSTPAATYFILRCRHEKMRHFDAIEEPLLRPRLILFSAPSCAI